MKGFLLEVSLCFMTEKWFIIEERISNTYHLRGYEQRSDASEVHRQPTFRPAPKFCTRSSASTRPARDASYSRWLWWPRCPCAPPPHETPCSKLCGRLTYQEAAAAISPKSLSDRKPLHWYCSAGHLVLMKSESESESETDTDTEPHRIEAERIDFVVICSVFICLFEFVCNYNFIIDLYLF